MTKVDEYEATALNALVDVGDESTEDDKSLGEALQLQLAAFAAFGRVKGKGKGKPKGKGKSSGPTCPSNSAGRAFPRLRPSQNAFAAAPTGTGQVTPFVNSQVQRGMLMPRIQNPHRSLLGQQRTLQTSRNLHQMREFS